MTLLLETSPLRSDRVLHKMVCSNSSAEGDFPVLTLNLNLNAYLICAPYWDVATTLKFKVFDLLEYDVES